MIFGGDLSARDYFLFFFRRNDYQRRVYLSPTRGGVSKVEEWMGGRVQLCLSAQ